MKLKGSVTMARTPGYPVVSSYLEPVEEVQPPSVVAGGLSDNKHSDAGFPVADSGRGPYPHEAPTATPIGNLHDRTSDVGHRPRPSLLAHVMPSVTRPGQLSLRLRLTDKSWTGFLEALKAEGFEVGDVVRIEAIR